ncbi:protocatechuate 3,4-dioxygenase subunit alpha [Noviherbaspirillum sp.]|uniref:protocatechuate 3,4-dioxygenase subunit alpha n=1 Tax=Noviherbaspirillum sp. TaxID=1926288 RepID=UPI002B473EA7|nr:protocatechuate 3,4-dioxygenase subunit alpha [Noviherbaspirillum sp.]HJV82106.1 protocatechuate 3,4-dioxygenase subunit alpha [Noviherbaspirillum sp.]
MLNQLDHLKETASQTAGPYVHIGLAPNQAGFDIFEKNFTNVLTGPVTKGERIRIEGRVIDGSGTPLRDVLLEIWQANAAGRYHHPADLQPKEVDEDFRGWGRACSDFETGVYRFDTIKPGPVIGRNGREMAPHINFWIVARGINIGLNTRMYFSDEAQRNAKDPVLNLIEWEVRRKTLIAQREELLNDEVVYRFDIRIQGEDETVFFDI